MQMFHIVPWGSQHNTAGGTGRVDIHIHNFVNKRGLGTALRA